MDGEEQPFTKYKHIVSMVRMHNHDFCGEQNMTHARYWQIKKYVCMIFFFGGGGAPGGAPIIVFFWGGGGTSPRPP